MAQQNGDAFEIPKTMKAIRYNKVQDWALVDLPVPEPKAHEVLVKRECKVAARAISDEISQIVRNLRDRLGNPQWKFRFSHARRHRARVLGSRRQDWKRRSRIQDWPIADVVPHRSELDQLQPELARVRRPTGHVP